jgi:predicted dehydrogenase
MKKIKVAVIGVGYLGRLHAEKYAAMDSAELVGICDLDVERANEVAAAAGTTAWSGYEELYGKVDAVSVVTPTESHCKIGMDFLSKGIDVLIEKPIAMDLDEAERLVAEAEKKKAILQVGHLERFNAAVVALNGRLRDPVFIESFRLSPFPNRSTDVDVILDLMIHDIDIILNLVDSDVDRIEAVGIPVISSKVDIANARLTFKNGCVANVTASRVSKERVRKINLFEHDACIGIDYATQSIEIARLVPSEGGGVSSLVDDEIKIEKTDSLNAELRSFLNCSATRTAPLVSGVDG